MGKYRFYLNLYIDEATKLTIIKTHPPKNNDELPSKLMIIFSQISRWCLPLSLIYFAFDKNHEHSRAAPHIAQYNSKQLFIIQFLRKWLTIFIHNCMDCQMPMNKYLKQNKAAILRFSKDSTSFNRSFPVDTNSPIFPPSDRNQYLFLLVDHFSNYIVAETTPKYNS